MFHSTLQYSNQTSVGMGQHHSRPDISLETVSGKEVRAMNFVVTFDWKFVVALGAAVIGSILAVKMEATAAERVSIHAIDACKECVIARSSC